MSNKPNYPLRQAIAAGALLAGGFAVHEGVQAYQSHQAHEQLVDSLQKGDALADYANGDIPHDKAVVLEAPASMPPNKFAKIIMKNGGVQWELTEQITPQADAQLDQGVQGGEQFVLEKDLVDPEAIEKYGATEVFNPNSPDHNVPTPQ